MNLEPGTVVGTYRIEGLLGRGGMAVVYRARHVEIGREVALKVLSGDLGADAEFVARFRREGRVQASLEHPHVVPVYEAGESDRGLYLAMALVEGPTLRALMSERAVDGTRTVALLGQVGDALDAAHAAGLVHRDVKPQNVLVGEADDAYLGDFGLTRVGGATGVTATGRLMGTVAYLAPEVVRGGEAGPASDRYAFAATLFECLAGTAVYPRRNDAAILFAHTSEPVPRISERRSDLPPALDDIFTRALAKDPDDRRLGARALVDAVEGALEEAGVPALPPPPPPGADALESDTIEPLPRLPPTVRSGGGKRRVAPWLAAAALAGAAVATAMAALADDDPPARAAIPPPLPGARVLGSTLAKPGHPLSCTGKAVAESLPSCTVVQSGLPGRTLVVPADGVIRRWAVRSARGELALVVLRATGAEALHQIARSDNEFVTDGGVHLFPTDLAVVQGDVIGLLAVPGGAEVGVRPGVDGATTERWVPLLTKKRPPDFGSGTGFDDELLLRVDYIPGGVQRVPHQVTGAAAAGLPAGVLRARRRLRFGNGRPVEVRLVILGDHFAFDEFIGGVRTARIDVPEFRPQNGHILDLEVYAEDAPQQLGIYIEFNNDESARILDHFYSVFPREFEYVE